MLYLHKVTEIQFKITLGKLNEGNDKFRYNVTVINTNNYKKLKCLICVMDINKELVIHLEE